MRVFATYNIKGGVGKTATAVNLAYLSAREGARTLVWDLDPQGAATFYFRIKPKVKGGSKKLVKGKAQHRSDHSGHRFRGARSAAGRLLLPSHGHRSREHQRPKQQLARLLLPLALQYDHLFLDCPPSISLVSEGVFVATDTLVVPTIPTTLSLRTLRQLHHHLENRTPRKPQMLPFFCMVDRRKALHRRVTESAAELGMPMMETEIPYSSVVEQMGIRRAPLATFAAGSEAAKAYQTLWAEIRRRSIL